MLLSYSLSREAGTPLYEQLYSAIKADILCGRLAGGERLPSKRALSGHLNISKITVETAYNQLLAEGYISSRERSGYYVASIQLAQPPASGAPQARAAEPPEPQAAPGAAASLFPFSVWARLMRSVILDTQQNLLQRVPSAGLFALRKAIADEFMRQRGVFVSPEQILIGAGTEYFYSLLIQFLGHGRRYALEALGHRKIAHVYQANAAGLVPIGMDDDGIMVESLEASGASVVHISPSHHFPTGVVMPISRRQALMAWMAEKPDRFIIEDDYDSEYRFSGRIIPTMQSMDYLGRVIYMNTFSQTITPALRISYMILSKELLPLWQQKMGFYSCCVPSFEQLTLTRFLDEGYFDKHLSRMKKHYRAQRDKLLALVAQPEFARHFTALRADAGLHFVLRIRTALSDSQLAPLLRSAGLQAPFLSSYYVGPPAPEAHGCVVVNYAELDADSFGAALQKLADML